MFALKRRFGVAETGTHHSCWSAGVQGSKEGQCTRVVMQANRYDYTSLTPLLFADCRRFSAFRLNRSHPKTGVCPQNRSRAPKSGCAPKTGVVPQNRGVPQKPESCPTTGVVPRNRSRAPLPRVVPRNRSRAPKLESCLNSPKMKRRPKKFLRDFCFCVDMKHHATTTKHMKTTALGRLLRLSATTTTLLTTANNSIRAFPTMAASPTFTVTYVSCWLPRPVCLLGVCVC